MSGLFNKLKDAAVKTIKEQAVSVPITPTMLEKLLLKAPLQDVFDVKVTFENKSVIIAGKAKKMLVNVPFSITLIPLKAEGRTLNLRLENFSPMNLEMVKKKVLHNPPVMTYNEGDVKIDLNEIDVVKAVPIGHIHTMEMEDNKLVVTVGLNK